MPIAPRDVEPLLRPRSIAVIGASATRHAQGNGAIRNLRELGFGGSIIPVHPTAATVDGLDALPAIEHLPAGIDTAVVAIPAAGVVRTLAQLQQARVRSAVVFSNGFSPAEIDDFRRFAAISPMTIHGPNCMGLINVSDSIRLYPSTVTDRVRPGKVALIAQSGSAAISLMNSITAGLSKVITMGSELQVTAPDYMRWLADDDATTVIGVVLEAIRDPPSFAAAAEQARAAGKSLVVLKVGLSDVGARAALAHTGAMISPRDAYDCFFRQCGIPTVRDYDELIASLECLADCARAATGPRIGIVGISGGETALAADIAAEIDVPTARWGAATRDRIRAALPGASGVNPLDLGASVNHTEQQDELAVRAILDDPNVDSLLVIQDAQATLTPTMLNNYMPRILCYGRCAAETGKPLVIVSSTAESTHPHIIESMTAAGVPVLRGLRAGLVALRNHAAAWQPRSGTVAVDRPHPARDIADIVASIDRATPGPLPPTLCAGILRAYGIPMVRSAIIRSPGEAAAAATEIGFPLVLKIVSPDLPHRSEFGGVEIGIHDAAALHQAIERMLNSVHAAYPQARIEGFELQEQLLDHLEAMAGFIATPPFGALLTAGTGGTLVELEADRAVGLSPLRPEQAAGMIARTRLGRRLAGYRNLIPRTSTDGLADLLARLSWLAFDLSGSIHECDLNPVLLQKESGEARVVDVLMTKPPAGSHGADRGATRSREGADDDQPDQIRHQRDDTDVEFADPLRQRGRQGADGDVPEA